MEWETSTLNLAVAQASLLCGMEFHAFLVIYQFSNAVEDDILLGQLKLLIS